MSLTESALALAKTGWKVFPVNAADKRPRTKHGHLDATRGEEQILNWQWQFDNNGAIATPTGNGLLVIDVDPRNGGTMPYWAPTTTTVTTQSGGWHLYYQIDEDIKSRAGLFGRGVDSKCAGGYVLLPPSPGYEWVGTRPRAKIERAALTRYMVPESRERGGAARLAPDKWHRGVIHDQVVAWAAYFASEFGDDEEAIAATWSIVALARDSGIPIDNARNHIDTAIRWVLSREGSKDVPEIP